VKIQKLLAEGSHAWDPRHPRSWFAVHFAELRKNNCTQ